MLKGCRWVAMVVMACGCAAWAPAHAVEQDIIVVLDNSGSMRRNDPQFLARTAVEHLVNAYGPDTRVALMLFDTEPRLLVPLTSVTPESRQTMIASLRELDYRGQWTNIPSAVERAIYHFRRQPDSAAPRTILFMTDGRVDTGDADRDRDNERWLLDEVTLMARDSGVRIFGIAFTEQADFRVIQTMAQRTDGDYLRANTPDELVTAFADLQRALDRPPVVAEPEPEVDTATEPAATVAAPASAGSAEPAAQSPLALLQQPVVAATLGGLLLLTFGGLVALRRRGPRTAAGDAPPTAFLSDLGGVTGRPQYDLATPVSVIGRQVTPGSGITSIVIDRTTVSRRHATIRWREGGHWIEDHGTTNGTFVNDAAVSAPRPLRNGDRIRVDSFEFEFRVSEPVADSDRTMLAGAPQDDRTVVSTPSAPRAAAAPPRKPAAAPVAAAVAPVSASAPVPAPAATPAPPPEAEARAKLDYAMDLLLGDDDVDDHAGDDDATVIFSGQEIKQRQNKK